MQKQARAATANRRRCAARRFLNGAVAFGDEREARRVTAFSMTISEDDDTTSENAV
jgi:hypothetical protein